jgi:glycine cleavage system H lipoate-binding protein
MGRPRAPHRAGSRQCPFLAAIDALTCELATVRKFVPGNAVIEAEQRCSSADWPGCPLLTETESPSGGNLQRCPHLREVLLQRCTASPAELLIPGGAHLPSRCAGPAHRYCSLYLARTNPHPDPRAKQLTALPPHLAVTPNHMWIDVHTDGTCHLGVDAFLVRVVGKVVRLTFSSTRGLSRPAAVLKVGVGLELPLVFPFMVDVVAANLALKREPEALTIDPYGRGWLYEGRLVEEILPTEMLRAGEHARSWLAAEMTRLTEVVHGVVAHRKSDLGPTLADGGLFADGLADGLDQVELLRVFVAFFA